MRSVRPPDTAQSSTQGSMQAYAYGLTYAEADRIANLFPDAQVARVREVPRNVVRSEFFMSSIVIGTEPSFLEIANMKLAEGRWLTDLDVASLTNCCVLGATVAEKLFPLENPMDQTVLVGADDRFRIVGILKYQGRAAGGTGWIVKPFDPEKLISVIHRVVH